MALARTEGCFMSNYLRKIFFAGLAVVVGLGMSSGAFAQGKGKGHGGGHGNGKGNAGRGGFVQRGGGGDRGGARQGNGNNWGRAKGGDHGGRAVFQRNRPQPQVSQQKAYRQPQPVYRQPQPVPVYRQRQPQASKHAWKQDRQAQKHERRVFDRGRGRSIFNQQPARNFVRQQQQKHEWKDDRKFYREQQKAERKQQHAFEKSWRRARTIPFATDQRNWRPNRDRGDQYRGLREYYSRPERRSYYEPYSYRQYYRPDNYSLYTYRYPTTRYYYQSSPYYAYNAYPSYYSDAGSGELIIRSIISSVFGGSPFGGFDAVFAGDPYYDPYYGDNGYYYYNGYYYNEPVYDFYQQAECYPTAYLSEYSPVYETGPTYYSEYYESYTTGYYPSFYSASYSPVSYFDYDYDGLPYDYADYGYGDSLLTLIPGGEKLERVTDGAASRILLAALGGAYGRGFDDGLYYDEYGDTSPYSASAVYLPASVASSLRTSEAKEIFDQGYELGYQDAIAQRDPYGRLDLVCSFLGQSIGL
jgi:hypothetical protein